MTATLHSPSPRRIIAVNGGIGSGKSVVCRILRTIGFDVYDCDSRARMLMDNSCEIKRSIAAQISDSVIVGGVIDRRILSRMVFSDSDKLQTLNRIVHGEVIRDVERWAAGRSLAFVETAILYQSGLDRIVDQVWTVGAPVEERIRRVCERSGGSLSIDDVVARIEAQEAFAPQALHTCVRHITNDGVEPLLPQVLHLLSRLSVVVR